VFGFDPNVGSGSISTKLQVSTTGPLSLRNFPSKRTGCRSVEMSIERLRDPDADWSRQFKDLGLNPN
jgi:hypothetical protein